MSHSGNPYRRARAGEPLRIPAQTYNEMLSSLAGGGAVVSGRSVSTDDNTAVIAIRNDTGADRLRYSVYGISAPVFSPDANDAGNQAAFEFGVALFGVTPTVSHAGAFAIGIEPIRNGGIGRAILVGATLARVEMTSESDRWADVKVGDPSRLVSGSGMAQLLWIQPAGQRGSQGFAWCVVRLGAGAAFQRARIEAFAVGAYGVADSAYSAKLLDANNQPTGTAFTLYVWSYGDTAGQVGREALSADGCYPNWTAGDIVPWIDMIYADGISRRCIPMWHMRRGCG